MLHAVDAIVLAAFILATSVWIGGYVAIFVVARVASGALDIPTRVKFFQILGRQYFWVGTPALIVALATGGWLSRDVPRGALFASIVTTAAVLVACFVVAVAQARRMTRLRQSLGATPDDDTLRTRVLVGARAAGILRAALGLLSVALVVLGAFLAV